MEVRLRNLPFSAKILLTCALLSFCLSHLASGILVYEITNNVSSSAHEHFSYKTPTALLRMLHQHTFGHGVMYFLVGLIFLGTPWSEKVKVALIALPFLGAWIDHASWIGLKFGSERWEWFSLVAGFTYAGSFLIMTILILRETWIAKK